MRTHKMTFLGFDASEEPRQTFRVLRQRKPRVWISEGAQSLFPANSEARCDV